MWIQGSNVLLCAFIHVVRVLGELNDFVDGIALFSSRVDFNCFPME